MPAHDEAVAALPARDRRLLELLAAGYSDAELAAALAVTQGTIRRRVHLMRRKLGARSRAHAVAMLLASERVAERGES